jgi:hypothetical protein
MNRTILMAVTAAAALFHPASATIKSGMTTIKMNEAISFASGKSFAPPVWNGKFLQTGVPCSLSVDSLDLFFLSHDCGTCMYYCPCELLGSARTFYISNKSIDQIGKENSLNLNDSAVFIKVESTKNCFQFKGADGCFLPSVAPGSQGRFCPGYQWTQPLPLIVATAQKKYAVAAVVPHFEQSCSPEPGPVADCRSYVATISLQWFLQTDGTADFRGIHTGVIPANPPSSGKEIGSFAAPRIARGLFDVLGRRIPAPPMNSAKTAGFANRKIYIDERTGKIMLIFRQ